MGRSPGQQTITMEVEEQPVPATEEQVTKEQSIKTMKVEVEDQTVTTNAMSCMSAARKSGNTFWRICRVESSQDRLCNHFKVNYCYIG